MRYQARVFIQDQRPGTTVFGVESVAGWSGKVTYNYNKQPQVGFQRYEIIFEGVPDFEKDRLKNFIENNFQYAIR